MILTCLSYQSISALLWVVIGVPAAWLVARVFHKALQASRLKEHFQMLAYNLIFYVGIVFVVISALHALGVNLTALLGTAGIIGVAIGFAAQTSLSNIISGIFLVLEHAFEVGDYITCDDITGKVESIDLMSVKLLTFDNTFIRVPNELFIKQKVINKTGKMLKLLQFKVGVFADQDPQAVIRLVNDIVGEQRDILTNPKPTIRLHELANTAIPIGTDLYLNNADVQAYIVGADRQIVIINVMFWTKQSKVDEMHATFILELKMRTALQALRLSAVRIV